MTQKLLFMVILSLSLWVTGCDDDETNPVTPPDTITSLVVGGVILRPYVDFLASVTPIYAQDNEVDSAFFADSLCDIGQIYSYITGNGYHWGIVYFNQSDSLRFESGDTAEVVLYVDNTPVTASVPLLAWEDDMPVFIEPSDDDSIGVGDDLILTWHKVEGADWYGLEVYFEHDYDYESLSGAFNSAYYSTTDTTFTIPGSENQIDGLYSIRSLAVGGPVPGTGEHNVSSPTITGDIYGESQMTGFMHIKVGVGLIEPVGLAREYPVPEESSIDVIQKIVRSKID